MPPTFPTWTRSSRTSPKARSAAKSSAFSATAASEESMGSCWNVWDGGKDFMKKRRQMRLTYVASGESVLVEMLDDEAPNVCEHVWDRLPIETKVIHGMYSGLEVFA